MAENRRTAVAAVLLLMVCRVRASDAASHTRLFVERVALHKPGRLLSSRHSVMQWLVKPDAYDMYVCVCATTVCSWSGGLCRGAGGAVSCLRAVREH